MSEAKEQTATVTKWTGDKRRQVPAEIQHVNSNSADK